MKRTTIYLLTAFIVSTLLFSACSKNSFTVKGVVSGADGQMMYLENVGVSSVETMDSVKLTAAGKFSFEKPRPKYPEFYRFRLNNQLINFAVDSTEALTFTADAGTFATSYMVEGSESAKAFKTITLAQLDANQAIGRLRKDYESKLISDTTYRSKVLEVAEAYKETARKYIYAAPMSSTAYFALFQTIDGLLFFDLYDKNDSKAYGAVATSYDFNYPESPRAIHLHNLALQSIKVIRQQRVLDTDQVNLQTVSYLDISLPNLGRELVKLSSVAENKAVLINFTVYQSEWSAALNMDLMDLYDKYGNKDFVIYQVSLDTDTHFWKNVASKLPWTCVHDPESVYSQVAALYNVRQLPALFLLNKKGDLVKRVEDLSKLEEDIKKIL
ncbi:peroxiredoxin [Parabacteroides sp. PF5-5]|uniref:TlpA disulfide reductase family protein n=1 Tax=unclassified Parabacteroides TaxID=2649774 RepID=UPI002474AF8A|nr:MULTISPECIES: TlpA disulfide reductase family protein [unclassified Parabacteroides]MDH6306265.1 peroxiredoxin [Parabacteroides sp. PH5-39]MDH6316944.1 peroxiredoxin [Parabacteroides sp. PF5-13]MDH6321013.1 peroxiredoxin [Parabacteroides sp. PH5-13]MDH6324745.1 peroxiredoxin [Parabacteroides sp. PH5-8]MDH6328129.1 peroxiredoxin [Parabacteroides sp. PH5-41]